MRIVFIKGAAPIGFGYHEGEEAELSDVQAKELIETGYAEEIKKAVVEQPKEVKKAVKK